MDESKVRQFMAFARRVAEEEAEWADWHNIVFGVDGKFAEMFPTEAERREFTQSAFWAEIEGIERALREGKTLAEYTLPVTTASGRFVVRLPRSLHKALTIEAREEGVSLNQLVLAKLSMSLRDIARLPREHADARGGGSPRDASPPITPRSGR
jgi:hypothetical protein